MTIGISKEMLPRLMDKISDLCDNEDNIDYYVIEKLLINECTELSPWLPIEQAPKDRKILLLWPELGVMEGEWIVDVFWCDMWELAGCIMREQPTHYQELTDPPK